MPMVVQDTMNGLEGQITVTIDRVVSTIAEARNITITASKTKDSRRAIGTRYPLNKTTGYEGTGTMTIYYGNEIFTDMMLKYMNTGVDTYFTIMTTNDDKTSTRGAKRLAIYGVNIDSIDLSKLDSDETFLEQEVAFTYERAEKL